MTSERGIVPCVLTTPGLTTGATASIPRFAP